MASGHPIPVETLADCLRELGVEEGNSLLTHTAFRSLYYGSAQAKTDYRSSDHYGRDLIRGLKNLVGPEGILMMPTEFLPDYQMASFQGATFDLRRVGTNRGFLCQLFLEFPDVRRSTHAIYNCAALGPRSFDSFLQNHFRFEYSMDIGSPWHELMKRQGKIVFLGASLDSHSLIHMPEYIMKQAYPRPVFFGRSHHYKLIDTFGDMLELDGYVHAIRWGSDVVTRFCHYLDKKYGIMKRSLIGETSIVVMDAQAQYDALMREIESGVSWYDAMTWK